MKILHTTKDSRKNIEIEDNSKNLLITGTKVAVFKTPESEIEALTFFAKDYFGDIIYREISKNKELIKSGIINIRETKKNLIESDKITRIADKKFSKTILNNAEINTIMTEVNIAISNIIGK